jgi:hypothetical protein
MKKAYNTYTKQKIKQNPLGKLNYDLSKKLQNVAKCFLDELLK